MKRELIIANSVYSMLTTMGENFMCLIWNTQNENI